MPHPALTQLRALRYFDAIPTLDPQLLDWLLLEDSMTQRFEQQGKQVSVTLIREGFVGQNEVAEEPTLLPTESRYWLREILLCADGEPGLPGAPWCRNRHCVALNWPCKIWGKPRSGATCLRHRH